MRKPFKKSRKSSKQLPNTIFLSHCGVGGGGVQNWNVWDGKCATAIFVPFGGQFPTLLFQTENVRNFYS